MELQRKFDLSLYYWLENLVPAIVNVEDGFPNEALTLPTAAIVNLNVEGTPFELGADELDKQFWRIDVFASNKAQRDELAYMIFKELECNIPVYDYDMGFPPGVSPSQLGILVVSKRNVKPIHVFKDLVEKLYWRSSVTFFTYYARA